MTLQTFERPVRVLHLEDSRVDHELVKYALRHNSLSFDIVRVETLERFMRQLDAADFDVVLADYRLPGFTALDAWALVQNRSQRPPFIILSAAIGEAAAVDAMRQGVSDYLLKDNLGKLAYTIRRAIEVRETRLARLKVEAELADSERRLAELTEHLQTSVEQERAAIAREVHDDIGGALAAVKLDLAWISRHSTEPAVQAHVNAAMDMLQHALGASQRIMMNLRPAILDQGLVAAIQWMVSNFEKRAGVRTALRVSHEKMDLPKEVQLVAYRTAQEALTNTSKHAACSEVHIDLSDEEGVLTLEVTDNGRGLNRNELSKSKAFGIKGLHERARTVGGWLDVSSGREGQGTSIILSVPLNTPIPQPRRDQLT